METRWLLWALKTTLSDRMLIPEEQQRLESYTDQYLTRFISIIQEAQCGLWRMKVRPQEWTQMTHMISRYGLTVEHDMQLIDVSISYDKALSAFRGIKAELGSRTIGPTYAMAALLETMDSVISDMDDTRTQLMSSDPLPYVTVKEWGRWQLRGMNKAGKRLVKVFDEDLHTR